jgi:hypothetical protein
MWRSQTKGRLARVVALSKLTKHTTLFQRKHALEFGLEIVELEVKGITGRDGRALPILHVLWLGC